MAKQRSGNSSGLDTAEYKMGTRSGKQNDNPQWRDNTNQGRGPTAGNTGTPEKRATFIKEKSSGEKSALSDMILDAYKARGDGMKPHIERDVEGIHSNTNVGRGPTKGNAGKKK